MHCQGCWRPVVHQILGQIHPQGCTGSCGHELMSLPEVTPVFALHMKGRVLNVESGPSEMHQSKGIIGSPSICQLVSL